MSTRTAREATFDTRMAKAMSSPVRVRALAILNERVASPSDIAAELGLPVANVAYHVKVLLRLDCVEQVDARPVRGALEHFYRATKRALFTSQEAHLLPASARHAFAVALLKRVQNDALHALDAGGFHERCDVQLTFTPLILDEQGWKAVSALLDETLDRVIQQEAASAARLQDGESGGAEVRTRVTLMQYEAPPSV